jgi:glycosyltransferase involved in cell wall biosynthesis
MSDLRLAYFSPLPSARSGIADFSREILPFLSEKADITLFAADPAEVDHVLSSRFPTLPITAYPDLRFHFDFPIYHMGNSLHHEAHYVTSRRFPGVLVLHDFHLHDFVGTLTVGRDDFLGYMREVSYEIGPAGLNQLRDMKLAAGGVEIPAAARDYHRRLEAIPLNKRLIDLSLGVICHSQHVQKQVVAINENRPVTTIPLMVGTYQAQSLRRRLPWPQDALIFATIGFLTPEKCLDQALAAFATLRRDYPQARYLVVGQILGAVDLPGLIAQHQLQDVVQHVGFAPDLETFVNWIATADVLVNLRNPTVGETSAAVLRAFAASRPVIVYDHGWYHEIPTKVCWQVPVGDQEALQKAMQSLADSPSLRQHMGHQALTFIQAHHHPQHIAKMYISFITELRNQLSA